ncbi:23S rRNA (adenine(2503)-C(2))-methyltransferase RlmN [Petroclostridium sp. X23]|uniref:23S rRNA (adenine(2503)-C(2))-methyltransferase RlmN n=1 Tax=Petroclostridium sp. X23 TaxID=3045146 RepID=UPI0024AE1290|nr:23S rRNA (adenine(2503)-C(2))-methyltransferase RlmN [Petroclostridium sp. X23]WHH59895.1 23S rRNA (adenine(2503)-C(2))-methyltransferase RlmN [Petroclostridium sp. X23]
MTDRINLKDFTFEQLEQYFTETGLQKFRAKQVFQWLHNGVTSFDEMTNLSKELRKSLDERCFISKVEFAEKHESKLDGTIKYLLRLNDGNLIESVIMRYKHGITICVSTQVGCRMGCGFCASTIGGLVRHLTAGEILDQVIFIQKDIGERISNIVLMGIGEPLDNYDNVIKFLKNVNHPAGLNIGYRHISLSTCGLVPQMMKLSQENMPITLSVSLHAPNNEIRNKIMPVSKKYFIEEVIKACKIFIERTNRRITFEYALISGVNDSIENARELSSLVKGMLCHVNLIPVNKVDERDYEKSTLKQIDLFKNILEKNSVSTTVRRELGGDINASCGQLRRGHTK